MAQTERRKPPQIGTEFDLAVGFLDFHRATLLEKIKGLDDEDLRRKMVPSGLSLLALVKHVAYVERWWFAACFGGQDLPFPWTDEDPDADFRIEPGETTEDVLELYRREVERSRRIVEGADPEDRGRRPGFEDHSLRWILLHMIQEMARHNGHADIMRELIDGATGE